MGVRGRAGTPTASWLEQLKGRHSRQGSSTAASHTFFTAARFQCLGGLLGQQGFFAVLNLLPVELPCVQGPSYTVDGWHLSWQNWDLHLGFNGREGLVLYDVAYSDPDQGGRRRPVLHRASIVEMAVPYADPR